jgi:hypothetical protein
MKYNFGYIFLRKNILIIEIKYRTTQILVPIIDISN